MFRSARIKLTAYYLSIMMFITLSFSAALYSTVTRQTQRALEMQERRLRSRIVELPNPPMGPLLDEETVKDMKMRTLVTLGTLNILVLLIAGIPGYWLAGKTLKPIEEMINKQKKFVADAAHELKTPLTALKTYLEVNLRDKKMDLKKSKTVMQETVEDIDSLTSLVNTLIKQSRYQGENNLKKERFNLEELISEVHKKIKPKADEKGVKINIEGNHTEIYSDRNSISELITIILDNAVKFNVKNGSVNIKHEKKDGYVFITFEDTGHGIDQKDLPYIFDRFYKADSSRSKSNTDGFGLGLSIAKEIVESQGGSISVKSKVGEGTQFSVRLPCSQ